MKVTLALEEAIEAGLLYRICLLKKLYISEVPDLIELTHNEWLEVTKETP